MIMNLNDDVGALRNRPRIVLRDSRRHRARRPTANEAGSWNSCSAETRIAAIGADTLTRGAAGNHKDQCMMDDPPIIWSKLQVAQVQIFILVQLKKNTSI